MQKFDIAEYPLKCVSDVIFVFYDPENPIKRHITCRGWDAQVLFPVPISSSGGRFEKNGRQITFLAGKICKLVYLILRQSGNV